MKHIQKLAVPLFFVILAMITASNAQSETTDKTLSPYFFVKSSDSGVEQFPLKSTSAQVNIAGVIADVSVTQIYKNEGTQAIEAIYVFPASTKASVYGMKMTIGERTIIAQVREREKARQEYKQAKQEGKSASLLEQQRPNVFQMSVANILPGDVIKTELSYTELLVPNDGIYEFVYPTVVGPRYSNQSADSAPASEAWVQNPYLSEGEPSPYTFDINVSLSGSVPIQEAACSSHKVNVNFESPSRSTMTLDESEKLGGNRDYILKYRLVGGKIESGILLYEGETEKFFLMMLQPPERITTAQIPPREYIFVVDVSGSMEGFPLDISKQLLKNLIRGLRPTDKFNVLPFASDSLLLSNQSLPATSENVQKAIRIINNQKGGGGTNLLPVLNRALNLPTSEEYSRSVIIITDGYVNIEKKVFDLIRNHSGNANIFAFGIGSSVNRYLIEGMAHVGSGEPFIVTDSSEAVRKAEKFWKYIQYPILTQVKVDFGEFEVYDVEPPTISDLFEDRPVIVFGKWKNLPKGEIRLNGFSGDQPYAASFNVSQITPSEAHAGIRYLWARNRISLLSDYNRVYPDSKQIREIIRLGLTYNLLTNYTSFIAVDSLVRSPTPEAITVKQPLPLPKGVSNNALTIHTRSFIAVNTITKPEHVGKRNTGGSVEYVPQPEPGTLFLLGSGLISLATWARKKKFLRKSR